MKMYKRFIGEKAKLLVATSLQEDTAAVLKAAEAFAKATSMNLRLTHVTELAQIYTLISDYPGLMETNLQLEDEIVRKAKEDIRALAQKLDPKIKVETNVGLGHVATFLLADAKASHASMIVCSHSSSHRFMPRGFSTSLSLMAESTVPVLTVNSEHAFSLKKKGLNIVVADDLRDSSRGAISIACELAFAFPGSTIHHLHVVPIAQTELNIYKISPEKLEKSARERLDKRFGLVGFLIEESNTRIQHEVKFGHPSDEIKKVVEKTNADFAVFGRHEKWHRRPLSLGKMPYHAMFNLQCPIILAPDYLQLA